MSYKHGGKGTRLYRIWKGMRTRCNNPKAYRYDLYGGKGVKICDEWCEFSNFRDWAMSNGYSDNLTIDRIDSDGNYCPKNCQWVTPAIQSRRRNYTSKYLYNGELLSLGEISNLVNIPYTTLRSRMLGKGLSLEESLNYERYSKPIR